MSPGPKILEQRVPPLHPHAPWADLGLHLLGCGALCGAAGYGPCHCLEDCKQHTGVLESRRLERSPESVQVAPELAGACQPPQAH